MSAASKARLIAELRAQIAGLEAVHPSIDGDPKAARAVTLGAVRLDAALPDGGLKSGALHEVRAADYRGMGAGLGFAAALVTRCAEARPDAPVLWCEGGHTPFDVGHLYGPGLAAFGFAPERLIVVSPARAVDLLWTMEEALRLGAFAAVVGEIDGRVAQLDLTATRRLQLAAEESGTPAFLLTGHVAASASAAVTRWCVASAPSQMDEAEAAGFSALVGRPRWQVRLERCRGALTGALEAAWCVEWDARQRIFCDVPPAREAGDRDAGTVAPFMQAV